MKLKIAALCVLASLACLAGGLLPSHRYRSGLTNAQIDEILRIHPDGVITMSARDWRGMRWELTKFNDVTNWCDTITSSNQFAALLLKNEDWVKELRVATNSLTQIAWQWHDDATNAWHQYDVSTNVCEFLNQQNAALSNALVTVKASVNSSLADLYERKAALEEKIADSKYIILRPFLKLELAAVEKIIAKLEAVKTRED